MAGFVYIMSNPAFPKLIKIGKSKKDPTTDRVHELNQTGVPEPFKVEYYAFVEDEDYLEMAVHRKFANKRPNKNREFFSVEIVEAIDAIRQLSHPNAKIKLQESFYVSPEELKQFAENREKEERKIEEERDRRLKAEAAAALEIERSERKKAEELVKKDAKRKKENAEKRFDKFIGGIFVGLILTVAGIIFMSIQGAGTETINWTAAVCFAVGFMLVYST